MSTSATDPLQLSEPTAPPKAPRILRRGLRFHGDKSKQLNALTGSPDLVVPDKHLVRDVIALVGLLDLAELRNKHKSLGRTPVDPQFKLTVWLYASLTGLHHASEVARALKTDAALKLAAGGHSLSDTVLKEFRRENGKFLEAANGQVLALAVAERIVDPEALAVDSMRLRADAATASMRTRERSKERLDVLAKADTNAMSDEEKAIHAAKVAKHELAVARCDAEGRTGHSVTDPQATLMKFPSGASLPGHRVTAVGSGTTERFIVKVLVDGDPTDFGKLGPAVAGARDALIGAGMPVRDGAPPMQVAADAGYMSQADLKFAFDQRHAGRIDVVLPEATPPIRTNRATGEPLFGRDEFLFDDTDEVVCPSGRVMHGPYKMPDGGKQWRGHDCQTCPLKSACTTGKQRTLAINPVTDQLHQAVRDRLAEPGGRERYNKRIATIEPIFSYIQDAMHFTRASSRLTKTVFAEVHMKALAYNLTRLLAARARRASLRALALEFIVTSDTPRLVAIWLVDPVDTANAQFAPSL